MNLPKHKIPIVEIPIGKKSKTFHQKRRPYSSRNFWKINIGKCFTMSKNI